MPGIRARRALIALLVLLTPPVALLLARALALSKAEAALERAGLSWAAEERGLTGARWIGLHRAGVEVDHLSLELGLSPEVALSGVKVDLAALAADRPAAPGGAGGGAPVLRVAVDGLDLYWGDRVLAEGLAGTIRPELALEGPGVRLGRDGEAWVASVDRPLDLGALSGQAHLELRWEAGALHGALTVPDAVVSHEALAARPLPAAPLRVEGDWSPGGALAASGSFAGIPLELRGQLSPSPLEADLHLEVPDAPLSSVVAAFGELIPEGSRATLRGTLGATASLRWPEGRWSVVPRASDLAADGVIPNPDGLREGPFTWRAPSADEQIAVRTTGEGVEGWVPLTQMGRLPAAVVAAEDAGFWTHPGYDLDAIQEALDAWAAGEERPRGGSTLTQQLAKNLFTGADRSLARKLRELLFSLELERRLGKARVLELYLNVVELGPDTYGAGAASDRYFLKRPEGLSWKEAAFLAAILPAPRTYYETAYRQGRLPTARIERVIDNLVRLGKLSGAEAALVRSSPLRLVPGG